LTSGIPVIAATGSCLEEAGGNDSLYVDPNNHIQLASYINQVISNRQLAYNMIEKGKVYAQRFSPEQSARQLMSLYNQVI
jgi:Glycosyltransferase